MRTPLSTAFAVFLGAAAPALAAPAPVALLVEERDDGRAPETILVEGERVAPSSPEEAEAARENFWETLRVTRAVTVTAPLPFTGAGGRVGVELPSRMLELGAEAEVFVIPPGETGPYDSFSGGVSVGAYLHLAPIPGRWGRRFYILGRAFRAFALGKPAFNAFGVAAGVGYRQPLDARTRKHAFVELSVERDYLYTYDDVLVLPRLTAGFRF